MLERLKANILFDQLLKRPKIEKAYKMVPPTDSWCDTITTVHNSLAQIRELPHEILHITSHDGLCLEAVYYPNDSDKTMIWVHGYTSHAERESAFPALFYRSLGFNVLIPYLRAHGPSEGRYIALGTLEHLDMMGWVDKINSMIPEGRIVLHGLSMGGGIVLDLSDKPMKNVKCMICDAPSMSVADLFDNVAVSVFKIDAEKVIPFLHQRFYKEFHAKVTDYNRLTTVEKGIYPLLVTAGSNEQMDEILQKIQLRNPADTTVLILPGCNHGNGMYKQTQMYQNAIKAFLNQNVIDTANS